MGESLVPRIRRQYFYTWFLLVAAGCGKKPAPAPTPNQLPVAAPDLSGMAILMLPVQPGAVPTSEPRAPGTVKLDGVNQLDPELSYWLRERAPRVRWVLPEAIDRALARNPAMNINPRALDVVAFRRAQVRRIGDPLFGDLRRLAAIFDTRYALVPVAAEFKPTSETEGKIEIALALIDTTFGDVTWFGVIAGDPGAPDSPGVVASAAQRVAGMLSR
jgi:hypothetical protein